MNPIEAQAALDTIAEARRELARSGPQYPLWRHAAFAAVMAALVLGQGFGFPWQLPLLIFPLIAIVWLVADDRRRYGLFVNGYRKGRTLPVTLLLLALMLGAMGGEIYARFAELGLLVKFGIAGFAFAVALAMSLWWTRVYDRELLGGDA
ncbi:hypothetical protein [Sphingopyxis sp. PET50]|uniref:hypothetical protein n=1 Tax=Sphingopyxis sp. PET50 TaxID=2976533 RepID=UPI0021AF3ADA|nr:hypothetical protein [Sphingopyxis sp. PET50]